MCCSSSIGFLWAKIKKNAYYEIFKVLLFSHLFLFIFVEIVKHELTHAGVFLDRMSKIG